MTTPLAITLIVVLDLAVLIALSATLLGVYRRLTPFPAPMGLDAVATASDAAPATAGQPRPISDGSYRPARASRQHAAAVRRSTTAAG